MSNIAYAPVQSINCKRETENSRKRKRGMQTALSQRSSASNVVGRKVKNRLFAEKIRYKVSVNEKSKESANKKGTDNINGFCIRGQTLLIRLAVTGQRLRKIENGCLE